MYLVKTRLGPVSLRANLALLLLDHGGEEAKQLEVAGRSDIVMTRELSFELERLIGHRLMNLNTHVYLK